LEHERGGETVGGSPANLQASRQERRIQILLWPTGAKLSTLQTLNNTMLLWEDKPAKCGSLISTFSDDSVDLVLSSLTCRQREPEEAVRHLGWSARRPPACHFLQRCSGACAGLSSRKIGPHYVHQRPFRRQVPTTDGLSVLPIISVLS
jgi:hypothetical protein